MTCSIPLSRYRHLHPRVSQLPAWCVGCGRQSVSDAASMQHSSAARWAASGSRHPPRFGTDSWGYLGKRQDARLRGTQLSAKCQGARQPSPYPPCGLNNKAVHSLQRQPWALLPRLPTETLRVRLSPSLTPRASAVLCCAALCCVTLRRPQTLDTLHTQSVSQCGAHIPRA